MPASFRPSLAQVQACKVVRLNQYKVAPRMPFLLWATGKGAKKGKDPNLNTNLSKLNFGKQATLL